MTPKQTARFRCGQIVEVSMCTWRTSEARRVREWMAARVVRVTRGRTALHVTTHYGYTFAVTARRDVRALPECVHALDG